MNTILKTKRFILKPLTLKDTEAVFNYCKHEELAKYMTFNPHKTIEDSKWFINHVTEEIKAKNQYNFWIFEWEKLLGTIGLMNFKWTTIKETYNHAEIGYWLWYEHRRNGIMSEALNEILRFWFEDLWLHKVDGRAVWENIWSCKTMLKAWFRHIGTKYDEFTLDWENWNNMEIFELLKKDFKQKN